MKCDRETNRNLISISTCLHNYCAFLTVTVAVHSNSFPHILFKHKLAYVINGEPDFYVVIGKNLGKFMFRSKIYNKIYAVDRALKNIGWRIVHYYSWGQGSRFKQVGFQNTPVAELT